MKKAMLLILSFVLTIGIGLTEVSAKEKKNTGFLCKTESRNSKKLTASSTSTEYIEDHLCGGLRAGAGGDSADYIFDVPNNGVINLDFYEVSTSPFDFDVTVSRVGGGSVTKRANNTDIKFTNMIGGTYVLSMKNRLSVPITFEMILSTDPAYTPVAYTPEILTQITEWMYLEQIQELTCDTLLKVNAGQSIEVVVNDSDIPTYDINVTVMRVGGGSVSKKLTNTTGKVTFTNMLAGNYKIQIDSKQEMFVEMTATAK
ncbi:carboxypeptidase-like regulatory domain-containing protein [Hazenella coriacea]|uniref:Uncharacterized protein n=1 Tax=Hazenella coriacea TaxID=1179467 RepID=A0A4R3L803_9BACL|nr:carboxypeptidase-like regulatory domain-containing protein [Hazenella coriacea]TCS95923.1 hypothetical protein EDD58_102507 [Hazenella coriacea]